MNNSQEIKFKAIENIDAIVGVDIAKKENQFQATTVFKQERIEQLKVAIYIYLDK